MSRHEKLTPDRPLPAMPATLRTPISSVPSREIKPPKNRDRERNRLKKNIARKSEDRLTLSSSSSGGKNGTPRRTSARFGDPDITPRPLNISKALPSDPPSGRNSIDLLIRETMQSRWSTSTSDVASGVSRKESKRKIFGITIPFKRRVKSEQMPAKLKISSGFFGGRFAGSKTNLSPTSPKYNNNIERQWQSSRASSTMTVTGQDGALSDEDTPTSYRFKTKESGSDLTMRSRIPQRRHTLTGNLLGILGTPTEPEVMKNPSRHSSISVHSSTRSGGKSSAKNFLSLFPRPPKRDSVDVMQMLTRNATMPLIVEGAECSLGGQPTRGFSNPLPVNLRSSFLQLPDQWRGSGAPFCPTPYELPNLSQSSFLSAGPAPADPFTTPTKERIPARNPDSEPKSILYTKAHKKPVLTHLDLQVTAEIDTINISEEREIWVVIELNGSLANNRDVAQSEVNSLDILFLLDLSQNMSEQAIATMRSTVGYILENISGTRSDSFGMAAFTSTSACEVLMPLVPCSHQAKHRAFSLLDKTKTTSDPFLVENPISNVVRAACSMFMPGFYKKNKNLIILSSAVPTNQGNMVDVSGFEDVKIHVIGVGCIYWPMSEIIYADTRDGGGGFCFPASVMDVTTLEDNHSTKLQSIARRFVRALRNAESIGMMRDINVYISPSEDTTIKAVIGKTSLLTLRAGERATIMVRMDVKSAYQKHHSVSEGGIEALEEGLYATLGMEKMKLLQVDVRYKHSLLPLGTSLTTTATAEAIIISRDSPWHHISVGSRYDGCGSYNSSKLLGNISPTPRQDFVRKALIQKVVSEHKNPKDALIAIENIARTTEEKDLDYCNVVRELRYQIRVWNGRRRGRVMGFGSEVSDISFQDVPGFRISAGLPPEKAVEKGLIRPFSFEVKTESLLGERGFEEREGRAREECQEEEERLPTPGLTNDSDSAEEEFEGVGYAIGGDEESIKRFEGDKVDSSPMTVIAMDIKHQQRPDDSATRLWKRIERAGEVGSIGGSSIGTTETRQTSETAEAEEGFNSEAQVIGNTNEGKKKGRKKRKKKKRGSHKSSSTATGSETAEGNRALNKASPTGTLRDVRKTEFSPFMM